jgi:hypothetical protein
MIPVLRCPRRCSGRSHVTLSPGGQPARKAVHLHLIRRAAGDSNPSGLIPRYLPPNALGIWPLTRLVIRESLRGTSVPPAQRCLGSRSDVPPKHMISLSAARVVEALALTLQVAQAPREPAQQSCLGPEGKRQSGSRHIAATSVHGGRERGWDR